MEIPVAAPEKVVVPEAGWLETFKQKLNIDGLMQKMNLSKERVFEIGLYLGIGFLAGFLFKKYAKYLFIVVLTVVGLAVLHHLGFVEFTINWEKVQGIQPIPTPMDATIWSVYWEWIKANVAIVLSFSVGFLVGFRVG